MKWEWSTSQAALLSCCSISLFGGSPATSATWQYGWASWYGPGLYGNRTACGSTLTTNTWGTAHRWYGCGTRLTVCYRRCVVVPVIDRGPYVNGRVLDLTYRVKQAIGMPSLGYVHYRR